MAPIAGSKLGTKHLPETRLKMSQAKQGKTFTAKLVLEKIERSS
jgi:hypothetical protein